MPASLLSVLGIHGYGFAIPILPARWRPLVNTSNIYRLMVGSEEYVHFLARLEEVSEK